MHHPLILRTPKMTPPLDRSFRPAVLGHQVFQQAVRESGAGVGVRVAIVQNEDSLAVRETRVLPADHEFAEANLPFLDRWVKALLWQLGGFRIVFGGPAEIGRRIEQEYAPEGQRAFDAQLMSQIYDRPFQVESVDFEAVPPAREPKSHPRGRHLNGCRVGFDAGASDHKVAAVVDGEVVFSEEVPWQPAIQNDPQYHIDAIRGAIQKAAEKMPRVDAIGVSSAGVYIDNRVKVASLFRSVPKDLFQERIVDLYLDLQKDWGGIPLEVANDGEVAALAGSMELDDTRVLGIALGSSEAGGYVTPEGTITSWLNELAFAPVDYSPTAPVDEWSQDRGVGGDYFSQKAVIRLAPLAGIELDSSATPAEQLKSVQGLFAEGDERAQKIFETIGCYLGYGLAHYAGLYDLKHIVLMGRVVSGGGGNLILEVARQVLESDFPDLAETLAIHLPSEASRRVGQAVAAASLPWVGGGEG